MCTAKTIHSLHYHAENSRKCERKQELVKSQGLLKHFAAPLGASARVGLYRNQVLQINRVIDCKKFVCKSQRFPRPIIYF